MSMIFPGMDPYLEDPKIWQGFHNRMVVHLADALQRGLGGRYITSVEERVFVEGPKSREIIPDVWIMKPPRESGYLDTAAVATLDEIAVEEVEVPSLEIHENYIDILDRQSGMQSVTMIEVVSPTNKIAGPGRDSYESKQEEVLRSQAHLVEIDLLRAGHWVVSVPEHFVRGHRRRDYVVSVNRAVGMRGRFQFYAWQVRQRLPTIAIPLAGTDPDVRLELQAVVEHTYGAGAYRERLRYDQPCLPPLLPEDQAWADAGIKTAAAG